VLKLKLSEKEKINMKRESKEEKATRILGEGHFKPGDMVYDQAHQALCQLSYHKLRVIDIVIFNRKEIYTD
jgi:hypothetical protein